MKCDGDGGGVCVCVCGSGGGGNFRQYHKFEMLHLL